MNFLEKDLEDIIMEASPIELYNRGLPFFHDAVRRQVNLGSYGIADIVGVNIDIADRIAIFTIYELKQKTISITALLQAARYVTGIKKHFTPVNHIMDIECKIVLIGDSIDLSNDFCFLSDFTKDLSVFSYSYKIDGIKFSKEDGFYITNSTTSSSQSDYWAQIKRAFRVCSNQTKYPF